jgi:hypothetical protein
LQDWPGLAITFQKLVKEATDETFLRTFPNTNPIFSLMEMASRNRGATRYLAIEENFLMAAIHVAAMMHIPFAQGTLPDLPAHMPSAPPGWVFLAHSIVSVF